MERYSEVIGIPVICVDNGKKIGIIKDMIFCPKVREVKAFILERKGCEIRKKVILQKDILSLGKDAMIVNDCKCIKSMKKVEESGEFKDKGLIKGLKVYSKSGHDLGSVEDILFDFKTGLVEGVEVSDGLLQDIVSGRNIVPLFGKVEFGEESIIVDKEACDEMTSTGGGIKKFLNEK